MIKASRLAQNPILRPDPKSAWEQEAVYNPSLVKSGDTYHCLYRSISRDMIYYAKEMEMSTVGYAQSHNGLDFTKRSQFIVPEYAWEQFGCEDPRATFMDGKFYIFYTAISNFPTNADGIKAAVAITTDFKEVEEKHLVTPFNAKAATLFPQKVNGKYAVIISVDTDRPPAKIAIAYFDKLEDIWSEEKWNHWKDTVEDNTLDILRSDADHVEIGAVPIKTKEGWLLVYSYIQNYRSAPPGIFTIEALLLDLDDPTKIIGRTHGPLLEPEQDYEKYGKVADIVFPSSALIKGDNLVIYYGAADTVCAACELNLDDLIVDMKDKSEPVIKENKHLKFDKFEDNPIIKPISDHDWESKYTLNPAAIRIDDQTFIVYRAMSQDDTSVLGCAITEDGYHITQRLEEPIYTPREDFEKKKQGFSGCEDPRITRMGDTLYMCYTAYDGVSKTKVALTTISVDDFKNKKWNWAKPEVISNPTRSDKNTCLFPKKIKDNYVFLHRMGGSIWIDYKNDLNFGENDWLGERIIMSPIKDNWDSHKIGIAAPPIETEIGYLLLYHGLSEQDKQYRMGAALLDKNDPSIVLSRLPYPLLEPKEPYEFQGLRPGTVFPCGAVQIEDRLYIYYGAADEFVAAASINFGDLLHELKSYI